MRLKELRVWKKVFPSDLKYITYEMKDFVDSPCAIFVEGVLGAGKTTFIKEFVHHFYKKEMATSPTYSLVQEYGEITHADLYRIESREELFALELEYSLQNKSYFLVEWGKKHFQALEREIPDTFSSYLLEVTINKKTDNKEQESRNFVLHEILD